MPQRIKQRTVQEGKKTKNKKYFAIEQSERETDISIFGEISEEASLFGQGVSGFSLSQQIDQIQTDVINVHINSPGGSLMEGIAIYSALKRAKGRVRTFADFACSIASVVFEAGDDRILYSTSMLFLHPAWKEAAGNAAEFRKIANDLEKLTEASITAYKERVNISEEKLREILDNETWLNAEEALSMGFATEIMQTQAPSFTSQKIRQCLMGNFKGPDEAEQAAFADLVASEVTVRLSGVLSSLSVEQKQQSDPLPENSLKKCLAALRR